MGRMISQFFGHVLPGIIRPLHTLWNQMIGFLFIVLAVWPIPSAIHYIRHFQEDPDNLVRIVLSFAFAAAMGSFGIASFLRARKISRS
jgi:hypothetical protein